MPQKLFRVKIYAYQYHADFIVKSADSALDIGAGASERG